MLCRMIVCVGFMTVVASTSFSKTTNDELNEVVTNRIVWCETKDQAMGWVRRAKEKLHVSNADVAESLSRFISANADAKDRTSRSQACEMAIMVFAGLAEPSQLQSLSLLAESGTNTISRSAFFYFYTQETSDQAVRLAERVFDKPELPSRYKGEVWRAVKYVCLHQKRDSVYTNAVVALARRQLERGCDWNACDTRLLQIDKRYESSDLRRRVLCMKAIREERRMQGKEGVR